METHQIGRVEAEVLRLLPFLQLGELVRVKHEVAKLITYRENERKRR